MLTPLATALSLLCSPNLRPLQDPPPEKLEECRKLLSLFDAFELPSVSGKTFVIYNTGWYMAFDEQRELLFDCRPGWLLLESEETVVLIEDILTVSTYPRVRKLPGDWDRFKETHPKELPLPGGVREVDFEKFCRNLIREGPEEDFGDVLHFMRGGISHRVEPALYAYWALQRGLDALAVELVELARKSVLEEATERGGKTDLEEVLRASLAGNLRWQAILGANEGLPRSDVLKKWRIIAKIASGLREGEAEEMATHYEKLIEEDLKWTEPSQEELAKMPPADRVRYWIHRLRDLDARQFSQPGWVNVLGPVRTSAEDPNPAAELVKLGWDALPQLIAHLDDRRPTRSMGFWRDFAPDS